MDKRVHFIWGNFPGSKNRIHLLKMNGMNKIYVLDKNQKGLIKECNDVTYFSMNIAPLLMIDQPGQVHHFFMEVPPRQYKSRVQKD